MPLTSMRPASGGADHGDPVLREEQRAVRPLRRGRPSATIALAIIVAAGALLIAPSTPLADSSESPSTLNANSSVPPSVPTAEANAPTSAPVPPPAAARPRPKASAPPREVAPPKDVTDLGAWLNYRHAAHLASLPDEARLFYRRGRLAARAGHDQDAIRLMRGAAELDPFFLAPHLTLASWYLLRDPSQTLQSYAAALDLVRDSFLIQIEIVANVVFFGLQGLFLGILATGLIIVLVHQAELRHILEERLGPFLSATSTRVWGWVLLIAPFAVGVGLALPALICLGALWPVLVKRERAIVVALFVALVAAPFSGHLVGRLAMPLRDDRGPLFGIGGLSTESWSPARHAAIQRLASQHPDDPYVQFGLGWSARNAGDLAAAEHAYRRVLATWPDDARVLNNLANVEVASGNSTSAIELYRRAVAADPHDAAAYFNLSQILTQQYDYQAASEAAARASAIDFELVKAQVARGTDDGQVPLADEWLAPATLWKRVLSQESAAGEEPVLPFAWRGAIETSGSAYAVVAAVLGLASLVLGVRQQRGVPLRACRNCGQVVCRRCAKRRRELALCAACAADAAGAESPDFVKVILGRRRVRVERIRRQVRTAMATVLPGYGLLVQQHVLKAWFMIMIMATLAAPGLGEKAPFAYQAGSGPTDNWVPTGVIAAILVLLYLGALIGYLVRAARAREADAVPLRARPSLHPRGTAKAA